MVCLTINGLCAFTLLLASTYGDMSWTNLARPTTHVRLRTSDYASFNHSTDLVQYRLTKTSSWQGMQLLLSTHLYSADSSSYIGIVRIYYYLSGDTLTSYCYVMLRTPAGGYCYNRTVLQQYGRVPQQASWNFTSNAADILTLDGNVTVSFTGCTDRQYEAWETALKTTARVKHELYTDNVVAGSLAVQARVHRSTCSTPQIENGRVSPNRTIGEGEVFYFSCDDGYILHGNSSSECTDNGTLSNIVPSCSEHCWNESEKQYLIGTKVAKLYDLENAKKVCECLSCSGISCQFKKGTMTGCHLYSGIRGTRNQEEYTSYQYGPCEA